MVTKTPEELDAMSKDEKKAHFAAEKATVFGSTGKEQGIGSAGNETHNHFEAMRLRELAGHEPPGTTERLRAEWEKRNKRKAG
jgi:hypothetical protein